MRPEKHDKQKNCLGSGVLVIADTQAIVADLWGPEWDANDVACSIECVTLHARTPG